MDSLNSPTVNEGLDATAESNPTVPEPQLSTQLQEQVVSEDSNNKNNVDSNPKLKTKASTKRTPKKPVSDGSDYDYKNKTIPGKRKYKTTKRSTKPKKPISSDDSDEFFETESITKKKSRMPRGARKQNSKKQASDDDEFFDDKTTSEARNTRRRQPAKKSAKEKKPTELIEMPTRKAPAKNKRKMKNVPVDDETFLLTNPDSEVTRRELMDVFTKEIFETEFTTEEQEEIGKLLPYIELSSDSIVDMFCKVIETSTFCEVANRFQEDLLEGLYLDENIDEEYEEQLIDAYDRWKEANFQEKWVSTADLPHKGIAGRSADISLTELILADRIKKGDIFHYNRSFSTAEAIISESVK
ncbi:hypothetical protein HK096_008321, partial [Nowakowskiella sp. JEL0078]